MIRAIRPEASVTIDGRKINVGGLIGQENQAFFTTEEVGRMMAEPAAMRYVGMVAGKSEAVFAWKRVRHHAPDVQWPPKGASVRFDFDPPASAAPTPEAPVLWSDNFRKLDPAWKISRSKAEERVSFVNPGGSQCHHSINGA